jgi:Zn-dependent protease with chaperone function
MAMTLLRVTFGQPSLTAVILAAVGAAMLSAYLTAAIATSILAMMSGPPPPELCRCARVLATMTGTSFRRVVYLESRLANGARCEVRPSWAGSALVINRWTNAILSDDERLAVLAHEVGHLRGHHFAQQVVVSGVLAGLCMAAIARAASAVPSRGWVLMAIIAIGSLVNAALQAAFRRVLERDADRYAARVAGAEPFVRALEKLSPKVDGGLLGFYDAVDVRAAHARAARR